MAHQEVEAVTRMVQQLLAPGTTWTDHRGATHALTAKDILMVAPYDAGDGDGEAHGVTTAP